MTWQTINEVLNRNKINTKLPDEFVQNNSNLKVANPVNIENKFNEYFVNMSPKQLKKFLLWIII